MASHSCKAKRFTLPLSHFTAQAKTWQRLHPPPIPSHLQSNRISEQCCQRVGTPWILFLSWEGQSHRMPPLSPLLNSASHPTHLPLACMGLPLVILARSHRCSNTYSSPRPLNVKAYPLALLSCLALKIERCVPCLYYHSSEEGQG